MYFYYPEKFRMDLHFEICNIWKKEETKKGFQFKQKYTYT